MLTASGVVTNEYFDSVQPAIDRIDCPGMQKVVFAKEPIADTVIFVKKPLKGKDPIATADDKYNLARKLQTIESKKSDFFVFVGKRIKDSNQAVIGFINNREDVIVYLVRAAAAQGHARAQKWLKKLISSDKSTTAVAMQKMGYSASASVAAASGAQMAPTATTAAGNSVQVMSADSKSVLPPVVSSDSKTSAPAVAKDKLLTGVPVPITSLGTPVAPLATPDFGSEVSAGSSAANTPSVSDVTNLFSQLAVFSSLTDVDFMLPTTTPAGYKSSY